MHTGGTFRFEPPKACEKHGLPLMRTMCGVTEIWTCAACNTEIIDRWANEPGTINIQAGQPISRPYGGGCASFEAGAKSS
ncbi:hypothetical protein ACIPUD_10610 [Bradyrhizobium sp. CAR08]